jgi:DNA-binding SARP family transcriptional activator
MNLPVESATTSSSAGSGDVLTVGVLGPLVVSVGGRPVVVSSPKLRMLLVVLAMEAGSPLSLDRLAGALWDGDLPEFVRRTTHTHLTRLRAALGVDSIVHEPGGYRLRIEPERVDALMFVRLLDAAAEASEPAVARAQLVAALNLWRGDPLTDLSSAWLDGLRAGLVERLFAAVERRVDLDSPRGRHRNWWPSFRISRRRIRSGSRCGYGC